MRREIRGELALDKHKALVWFLGRFLLVVEGNGPKRMVDEFSLRTSLMITGFRTWKCDMYVSSYFSYNFYHNNLHSHLS